MYFEAFSEFKKLLGQMDKWLEAAAEHATAKKFDSAVYLTLRLAPDQFPFVRQVQTACDTAKLGAARLTGKEAPKHADDEQTLDQLRARIQSTISFLSTLTPEDFAGAAERKVSQPRWEGKFMHGADYFLEHAQPNFFFHYTHTYALLRHNGVNLGKRDYLGPVKMNNP